MSVTLHALSQRRWQALPGLVEWRTNNQHWQAGIIRAALDINVMPLRFCEALAASVAFLSRPAAITFSISVL